MRRSRYLLAVLLVASVMPVHGQEPAITYPAGSYSITTPGPTSIERGVGFVTFRWVATPAPIPAPTPKPDPVPPPPASAAGPVYVSLILPAEPTQAQAAMRDELLTVAWRRPGDGLRIYTDGQAELKTLGLAGRYAADDLPVFILQAKSPASDVWPVARVLKTATAADLAKALKELRGQ